MTNTIIMILSTESQNAKVNLMFLSNQSQLITMFKMQSILLKVLQKSQECLTIIQVKEDSSPSESMIIQTTRCLIFRQHLSHFFFSIEWLTSESASQYRVAYLRECPEPRSLEMFSLTTSFKEPKSDVNKPLSSPTCKKQNTRL